MAKQIERAKSLGTAHSHGELGGQRNGVTVFVLSLAKSKRNCGVLNNSVLRVIYNLGLFIE